MFFKLKKPTNDQDDVMSCNNMMNANNEMADRYQQFYEKKNATLSKNYKQVFDEFRQSLTQRPGDQDGGGMHDYNEYAQIKMKNTPPMCCSTPSPIKSESEIESEFIHFMNNKIHGSGVNDEKNVFFQPFNILKPTATRIVHKPIIHSNISIDTHEKNIEHYSPIPLLPPRPITSLPPKTTNQSSINGRSYIRRSPSFPIHEHQNEDLSQYSNYSKSPKGNFRRRHAADNNNNNNKSSNMDSNLVIEKLKNIILDMHLIMKPPSQASIHPSTCGSLHFPPHTQKQSSLHQTQPQSIINIFPEENKYPNATSTSLVDKLLEELIRKVNCQYESRQNSNTNVMSTATLVDKALGELIKKLNRQSVSRQSDNSNKNMNVASMAPLVDKVLDGLIKKLNHQSEQPNQNKNMNTSSSCTTTSSSNSSNTAPLVDKALGKLIKKLNYQSEYGPNSINNIFGTPLPVFGFTNNDLNMFQNDQFVYPFFNSFTPSISDTFNTTLKSRNLNHYTPSPPPTTTNNNLLQQSILSQLFQNQDCASNFNPMFFLQPSQMLPYGYGGGGGGRRACMPYSFGQNHPRRSHHHGSYVF
jgi:hypothetical protein